MAAWKAARLDEIGEVTDGRVPWRPVRAHFGIASFGINAFLAKKAGERLINEHDEADDGHEELYLVQSGHARFELDGETLDAPAGTLVFVPAGVKRTAFAEADDTTVVVTGGAPGQAYEASGWEVWAPFHGQYEAGEYSQLADRLDTALADDPPYATVHYNAACVYSLAGRKEQALAHLRRGIELSDRVLDYARNDSDLDAIRGEPGFAELVG